MNEFNQEIIAWLEGDQDFDQGLALFFKYSRQRSIYLGLQRKRHLPKLVYELKKLSQLKHLKPLNVPKAVPAAATPQTPVELSETAKHNIIRQKRITREDLPDDKKPLFDQIAESYKIQRVYHEKMKLATTDHDRSALRAELVKLDDFISTGYDVLETAIAEADAGASASVKQAADDQPLDEDTYKLINNARSAISKMVKSYNPSKKDKLLKHLQVLIDNKVSIKADTHQKLVELNVIAENSNIMVR